MVPGAAREGHGRLGHVHNCNQAGRVRHPAHPHQRPGRRRRPVQTASSAPWSAGRGAWSPDRFHRGSTTARPPPRLQGGAVNKGHGPVAALRRGRHPGMSLLCRGGGPPAAAVHAWPQTAQGWQEATRTPARHIEREVQAGPLGSQVLGLQIILHLRQQLTPHLQCVGCGASGLLGARCAGQCHDMPSCSSAAPAIDLS